MAAPEVFDPAEDVQVGGEETALPQPRLDRLPEELVSNIALRLDYDDVASLRLACRTLEARSFHDFATEYFTAKAFMVSTESLKVLDAIATNKRLCRYLHSICIVTAFFAASETKCRNGCHGSFRPTVRQAEAYRIYTDDQEKLKETSQDKDILTDAFRKLPALTSLHLADGPVYNEDLDSAEVHGLRKVIRRTGRSPLLSDTTTKENPKYAEFCTHVWKVMCQSVARSGMTSLMRFGTQIGKTPDGLSVAKDLKLSSRTLSEMTKGLQQLKSVRLSISGDTVTTKDRATDRVATIGIVQNFAKVLCQPQLEEFTVSYDMSRTSGMIHVALTKNLNLENIKKLAVDGVYISASALVKITDRLTSIEDLQLSWSNLTKGNWVPVLQAIHKLEKLDHLHLMWLQEAGRKVYFLPQREPENGEDAWVDENDADLDLFDDSEDEDLPDLEPVSDFDPLNAVNNLEPLAAEPPPPPEQEEDFVAPGYEGHESLERGYYICLKGAAQINKYLPTFIKEYNLGESLDDQHHHHGMGLPLPPMGGPGGAPVPAALNAALNNLFGPVPPGAQVVGGGMGPPPGFGPPPPPGFVTMGHGPGYQVMMGIGPPGHVHGGHGHGGAHGPGGGHGHGGGHGNGGGHGGAGGPPAPANTGVNAGPAGAAGGQPNGGAQDDFGVYFESEEEGGGWDSPVVDDVD